eukprot:6190011-Pleurochrysis_carterae.AAC.1
MTGKPAASSVGPHLRGPTLLAVPKKAGHEAIASEQSFEHEASCSTRLSSTMRPFPLSAVQMGACRMQQLRWQASLHQLEGTRRPQPASE